MALDLSSLSGERRRSVLLCGALDGFEIEIRHRTLKERERFEQKMIHDGVMKKDGSGVNPGRLTAMIEAYTEEIVTGWLVPDRFRSSEAKDENPPYSPKEMAKILMASPQSLDLLIEAVKDEQAFFSANGSGLPG